MMLVSIIIPTVRAGSISDAIEAVLRQTSDDWELIVVPQGDDPDLLEVLDRYRRRDGRISYVHVAEKNASNARNVGTAAARGDVFAFTDDDCEVAPDFVEVMRELYTAHPDVGFLGGELVAPPSEHRWRISTCPAARVIDAIWHPRENGYETPPGFYLIGANISVRREAAQLIGPYDVALGAGARFASCEDQDWGFRAAELDVSFMSSTRLVVVHTTGRRYGVRQFLRHQRNYALGRGAWVTKLRLWGHPMGEEWSRRATVQDHVRRIVTKPHRWLLERFGAHYQAIGAAEYAANYEVGADRLSHRKADGRVPVASTT